MWLSAEQIWAAPDIKKKMTLNTYCYDCGHLFINFPFFWIAREVLLLPYEAERCTKPIETERTGTLAKDHFQLMIYTGLLWIYQCPIV